MDDVSPRALADAFVDAIAKLELDPSNATSRRHGDLRYFFYPTGRDGSAFTHEFFPHALPAAEAISLATSLANGAPHLIVPVDPRAHHDVDLYTAAGYTQTGDWMLMARPLREPLALPGDERAALIADAATEQLVMRAIFPDGGTGHPARGGHAGDEAIRQRWIAVEGEPASFGRLVMLGDLAYLGDVATPPAFRRQGLASAIVRMLLDDALAAGARHCLLASTAMAQQQYLRFGFTEAMPLVELRSVAE